MWCPIAMSGHEPCASYADLRADLVFQRVLNVEISGKRWPLLLRASLSRSWSELTTSERAGNPTPHMEAMGYILFNQSPLLSGLTIPSDKSCPSRLSPRQFWILVQLTQKHL
jgi:hypothetical protein